MLNILFLGDVVSHSGREAIARHLPKFKKDYAVDFVITNAENAAGGWGLTPEVAHELYSNGVNSITLGNHTWSDKEITKILGKDNRIIRPYNYPKGTVGRGWNIYDIPGGKKIAVVNMMCRLFMEPFLDCPFQASKELREDIRLGDNCDAVFIDIHGETTSEKCSIAHTWDGKASFVSGSHTHVPTADERILPGGTGFHTDAGMCGDYSSIIGLDATDAIKRFTYKGPKWHPQRPNGEGAMCGTFAQIGDDGLCTYISPVRIGAVLNNVTPNLPKQKQEKTA